MLRLTSSVFSKQRLETKVAGSLGTAWDSQTRSTKLWGLGLFFALGALRVQCVNTFPIAGLSAFRFCAAGLTRLSSGPAARAA